MEKGLQSPFSTPKFLSPPPTYEEDTWYWDRNAEDTYAECFSVSAAITQDSVSLRA